MKANYILTIALLAIALGGCSQIQSPNPVAPNAPANAPTLAPAATSAPPPTVAPSPTAAPTQPPASNLLSGTPREIVRNAFTKLNAAGPYRIRETQTTTYAGKSQTAELVRELVPPDRVRMLSKPALIWPEIIIIGKVWYVKDENSKWSKSDKPVAENSKSVDLAKLIAEAVTDVQFVGPELLNAAPTMVYALKFNFTPAGVTYTGAGKVWIGVTDGLPHQYESQGTMTQSGALIQIQSRVTYEYDPSIKITAPIP